jgi:hypothetical protein
MSSSGWYWRLQRWQWLAAGRAMPRRRALALASWWLPCVIAPLALLLSGANASAAGADFLLSLDVPLTLALAGLTVRDTLGAAAKAGREDWLWPRSFRPAQLRWLSRLRWLIVGRWPAGLGIAAALLAAGAGARRDFPAELLLMALLALLSGASLAWALPRASAQPRRLAAPRRARGLPALSWVALHEARERFVPRRAAVFAIPALLAAPAGASAGDAARMLLLWLPLVFIVLVCREAASADHAVQRWLQAPRGLRLRLRWWVWRHVTLGVAAILALCIPLMRSL